MAKVRLAVSMWKRARERSWAAGMAERRGMAVAAGWWGRRRTA